MSTLNPTNTCELFPLVFVTGAGPRLLDKPYRKRDLARVLREVLSEPAPVSC
jgi:hypothetical protein